MTREKVPMLRISDAPKVNFHVHFFDNSVVGQILPNGFIFL